MDSILSALDKISAEEKQRILNRLQQQGQPDGHQPRQQQQQGPAAVLAPAAEGSGSSKAGEQAAGGLELTLRMHNTWGGTRAVGIEQVRGRSSSSSSMLSTLHQPALCLSLTHPWPCRAVVLAGARAGRVWASAGLGQGGPHVPRRAGEEGTARHRQDGAGRDGQGRTVRQEEGSWMADVVAAVGLGRILLGRTWASWWTGPLAATPTRTCGWAGSRVGGPLTHVPPPTYIPATSL